MPQADLPLLQRGVYQAPCLGPQGETILYAVRANHCIVPREIGGIVFVLPGVNPFPANDELWELLDTLDPAPVTSSSQGVA